MATPTVDKTKAKSLAREALADNTTARAAANSINSNPLNKKFRALDQDNFNPDQTRYTGSDDYAEKAQDNRWLVVVKDEAK
jgi:hypothetical protein